MPSVHIKEASSEAAWALLTEGVTASRLELHRLKILYNRCAGLVESSERREHLYQVAGDAIVAIPERIARMEVLLDRTSLALATMGETFLSARLPLSEKQLVEEATSSGFGGGRNRESRERVTREYMARKLRGRA